MCTLVTRSVWVLVMELQLVVVQSHLLHLGERRTPALLLLAKPATAQATSSWAKVAKLAKMMWMTSLNFNRINEKVWKNCGRCVIEFAV